MLAAVVGLVIHGTLRHSIGVSEEREGGVGYNHVWTVPGEEMLSKQSLTDHVARSDTSRRV